MASVGHGVHAVRHVARAVRMAIGHGAWAEVGAAVAAEVGAQRHAGPKAMVAQRPRQWHGWPGTKAVRPTLEIQWSALLRFSIP